MERHPSFQYLGEPAGKWRYYYDIAQEDDQYSALWVEADGSSSAIPRLTLAAALMERGYSQDQALTMVTG